MSNTSKCDGIQMMKHVKSMSPVKISAFMSNFGLLSLVPLDISPACVLKARLDPGAAKSV